MSYALAETEDGYDNQLLIGHKDNDTLYLYVNDVKHKAVISGDLNGAIQSRHRRYLYYMNVTVLY